MNFKILFKYKTLSRYYSSTAVTYLRKYFFQYFSYDWKIYANYRPQKT